MNKYICPVCKGTGYSKVLNPAGDFETTCMRCEGTGKKLIKIPLEEYDRLRQVDKALEQAREEIRLAAKKVSQYFMNRMS